MYIIFISSSILLLVLLVFYYYLHCTLYFSNAFLSSLVTKFMAVKLNTV